ncbi:two-component regulator propeller domain-containing protein [Chitinophaga sp. sic0106]|uniref:ligand-binding sensor domain-containing protein n=1 Tax=Chitinophaga sp. sic0106 TaxID=2854785 RepID=UPI001C485119|nr:two-component regulator propeller domain-containing protein [Chitinophaga sp. sic0106]MBV7532609.1 histidine kinase [Chitinophaga sp. sic0106]
MNRLFAVLSDFHKAVIFTFLPVILLYLQSTAQSPFSHKFTHLDITNGLASNHVSAILQDRKGFIWIASTALQRYDGTNLITVASFDRVPGSIYYDDICLCEDRSGRIWMGTPDNIRVYDPVTSKVKTVKIPEHRNSPEDLSCSHILEDHLGVIWASTNDGLLRYDEKNNVFNKATNIPEHFRQQIHDAIVEDNEGNIWFSGQHQAFILSADRSTLYHKDFNPKRIPVLDIGTSFKKIYIDKYRQLWMAGRGGMAYRYNTASMQLDTFHFLAELRPARHWDAVFDIHGDAAGNIWMATEPAGIFRYNQLKQQFDLNIPGNNNDPQGLHYDYEANCIMSDREGYLWVGTDHGINIMSLHGQSFKTLDQRTPFLSVNTKLPQAEVTGLFQGTNGNVYIGYWGKGFACLSPDLSIVNTYAHDAIDRTHSIPEERSLVWSFAELKDGTVLIGQENGNLSLFDPVNKRFVRHLQSDALKQQTLLDIHPYNDTTVYIGLYKKGLAAWNPQTDQFTYYNALLDSLKRPASVMDIVPQKDGKLWLATSTSGLLLFNPKTRQIEHRHSFRWDKKVYVNVTSLYQYNDTTLLAGTDHGLWIVNTINRSSHPILNNRQLFDEWILSIAGDRNQNIWLTTQHGFYKLKLKQEKLQSFVQGDDIIDNDRKVRRRILELQNGMLLIGASDHAVSFDPAHLQVAPPPPDVTILNMRVMDSTIQIGQALRDTSPIQLNHRQNFISIEFKSLQYHQEKINYYYQLEGVDEKWVSAEGLLVAKYTNLPPGLYTFLVKAANATGTFSDNVTVLQINILPAFWQTDWFRMLAIILAIAVIYLYVRFRINLIRREARQRASIQQEMAQLEMKALRSQMNPHFIFNALNSIQIFMMKNETESALSYLSRFAKLIRNVLDNSQLNNISVSREVSMLENYMELEKLRFTDQFEYKIIIDPNLEADMVEIPTMIVQPFVENAIWHGLVHKKEKGRVTITFEEAPGRILCTIEDNGVGREKSAAIKQMQGHSHHSRGLQITRDRLAIYNSRFHVEAGFEIEDLYDSEGKAAGTRVVLWFPQELLSE